MSEENKNQEEYLEQDMPQVPEEISEDGFVEEETSEPVKKKWKFSLFNFIFKKPPFISRIWPMSDRFRVSLRLRMMTSRYFCCWCP